MPEELDAAATEELPPFSFLKKPIKSVFATSVISSILNKTSPDKKPALKPTFNNINYDEQIRAPRMSVASHYTYKPESPRPFTDRKSLTLSRSTSHELILMLAHHKTPAEETGNDTAATSAEPQSQYLPATADLNQSTRRGLEPLKPRTGLITNAVLTYATNNYFELPAKFPDKNDVFSGDAGAPTSNTQNMETSEVMDVSSDHLDTTVLLDRLKLLRAIDNLNSNTTTAERADLAKDEMHVGGRIRSPAMGAKGPGVQQVYNLKKPLCTPAVLRPNDDNEMDEIEQSLELEALTPIVQFANYPFEASDPGNNFVQQEPTHVHWMPNNSSDHCMKCFEMFGTFFNPQRRRRHHCRFCGMLFCHDCLYESKEMHYFKISLPEGNAVLSQDGSSNDSSSVSRRAYSGSSNTSATTTASSLLEDTATGVMMDFKARFVVPLFRNLVKDGEGTQILRPQFKQCKVCKTCGSNYQKLVTVINLRSRGTEDLDAPYLFIENPYRSTSLVRPSALHPILSRSQENVRDPERNGSLTTNVPSDWTWSSF